MLNSKFLMTSVRRRFFRFSAIVFLLSASAVVSMADVRFASGSSALKIPFKLWNNHIYIRTSVNNSKPFWFLLDTGAANIINRRNAEALGLKLTPKGRVGGVGESAVEAWSIENVSFSLPGVTYSNQPAGVLALEPVEACANKITADRQGRITEREKPATGDEYQPIDGILGYEFFKTFVVEIDYAARRINLHDPKSYQYSGQGGEVIPIESAGIHIFVRAPVTIARRTLPDRRFLVDTGAVLALVLNRPFIEQNKLLPPPEQTRAMDVCGIGGKSVTQVSTVENLRLKNFNLENTVTLFSQATGGVLARPDFDGIIGNAILRRFRVIFDYSRGQMILEPAQDDFRF